VEAVGVEDVRADDQVVRVGFAPLGPVRGSLLEHDAVALGVPAADHERRLVAIGLHDAGAERRGDDAGQAGACAELEQAQTTHRARGELVRERDGGGPECDAIGQAWLIAAQELFLVVMTEDGAGVQDGPRLPSERQAVFLERQISNGGGERFGFLRRHGPSISSVARVGHEITERAQSCDCVVRRRPAPRRPPFPDRRPTGGRLRYCRAVST
jgi:hypothetical protein